MNNPKRRRTEHATAATGWVSCLLLDEDGGSPMEQVLVAALSAAVFGLFLLAIRK